MIWRRFRKLKCRYVFIFVESVRRSFPNGKHNYSNDLFRFNVFFFFFFRYLIPFLYDFRECRQFMDSCIEMRKIKKAINDTQSHIQWTGWNTCRSKHINNLWTETTRERTKKKNKKEIQELNKYIKTGYLLAYHHYSFRK